MSHPLKIGLPLHVPQEKAAALSQLAEASGFDSVWISEHLIWPAQVPNIYPYAPDGAAPVDDQTETQDPWVVLASVASCTSTIKLGSWVYVLPLRDPFVSARAIGCLDTVSAGRVLLGIGVGWLKDEFELARQPWSNRGKRAEEIMEILRLLWTGEVVEFHGKYYQFPPVRFTPTPPQRDRIPIYLGGTSEVAIDRATRCGDGWIGLRHGDVEETAGIVSRVRAKRADHGFDPALFEVTVATSRIPDVATADRYAEIGVNRIILKPWRRDGGDWDVVRTGVDKVHDLLAQLG